MALGLGVFYLWPAVRTLYLSFTESGPFGGAEWVGGANYAELFANGELLDALRNTAVYTVIALVGIPIAVTVAALLNTKGLKGRAVYRVLYFLPAVTMPSAVAIVWRMLYNGDFGMVNQMLRLVGLPGASWLTQPSTALVAIAIVGVWAGLGTNIVIFLAGLQNVPEEIVEAAQLDGAGPLRRFVSITLPMISPSIFFVSVISVIASLQVFDLVYMMLGRSNPAAPSTRTVVSLFYEAGFQQHEAGLAAAIAFVLLVLVLGLTALQFRLQRRWVHYG